MKSLTFIKLNFCVTANCEQTNRKPDNYWAPTSLITEYTAYQQLGLAQNFIIQANNNKFNKTSSCDEINNIFATGN